jgi:ABC-2 type transport system permease protein
MTASALHFARDSRDQGVRHIRAFLRQPWWIVVTLMQPIIWLLLFGALFEKVVEIPGFTGDNYLTFLAPGVVIMTALFSSGWAGMPVIEDLDRGVMDRMLVTPVRRGALIAGRIAQGALMLLIQSVIIVGLALAVGATFDGGVEGVLALFAVAILLGTIFGTLSIAMALVVRHEETLIAIVTGVTLPLTFLSTSFQQKDLMPGWMQTVADINPVNWAVEAGREAVSAVPDWGFVASRAGFLAALTLVCGAFATRAFRAYQKSV